MNKHLNIYKTYTKVNRENYQLEDDLTRALAIALQENDVFLHQFLKEILSKKDGVYENLFDDYTGKEQIEIDIQKNVESITDFNHLFAVRISGIAMGNDFYEQTHEQEYNPITDMYIKIDNVAIIFEVKPGNHNSTAQLYNQALNTIRDNDDYSIETTVTAVDFNWPKLMQVAVKSNSFQEAIGKTSRLLGDFISYIKMHNYQWLPQLALSALSFSENSNSISKRLNDAIENSNNTAISNRLGIKCNFGWAEEILIYLNKETRQISFSVYPGNTKAQGYHIFKNDREPKFKLKVNILEKERSITKKYHIKFSGQSYITGLWANEYDIQKTLYSRENFIKFTGRKKRENNKWKEIANLFDTHFKSEFDWKSKCHWNTKIVETNRTRFDLSFGYEISFSIPYEELQKIDRNKNDLNPLITLLNEVKDTFITILNP